MGRNNHFNRRTKQESYRHANREERGGRVLKVFRTLDCDDSSLIAGALKELAEDGSIPPIKTPIHHPAYLLDPRMMPRNFNSVFISGYQFGRIVNTIDKESKITDEGYGVNIGEISLLPKNRRTLLVELDSERLREERVSLYRAMGEAGVKGFSEVGRRKGHRDGRNPMISIGNFAQPVSKADEEEMLEAITTSVAITFTNKEVESDIQLGALMIKSYQPR